MFPISSIKVTPKSNSLKITPVSFESDAASHSQDFTQESRQDEKTLKLLEDFKKEMVLLNLNYQATICKKDKVKKYLETFNNSEL